MRNPSLRDNGMDTVFDDDSAGEQLALYFHIPYCLRKCPYCDFNSVEVKVVPEGEYVSALLSELRTYHGTTEWGRRRLATVYFGGGTPSLLKPASVDRLLREATGLFGLASQAEITLEANPAAAGALDYQALARAGVNRLSLGVQSFDDRVLKRLGRLHTAEESWNCFRDASAAGFINSGIDLIFGVPGESPAQWRADLFRCLELSPAHISTYELTIEPGTRFHRMNGVGLLPPRREEDLVEMYATARHLLTRNGYQHYEISNFSRPGLQSCHNSTYWRRGPYLGIGAGAHSFDPAAGWGRRWSNVRDPSSYIKMIIQQGSAAASTEELSKEQAIEEFVFLGLRQINGIDERKFERLFGGPLYQQVPQAPALVADGLLALRGQNLVLTERGLPIADSVLAKLIAG